MTVIPSARSAAVVAAAVAWCSRAAVSRDRVCLKFHSLPTASTSSVTASGPSSKLAMAAACSKVACLVVTASTAAALAVTVSARRTSAALAPVLRAIVAGLAPRSRACW